MKDKRSARAAYYDGIKQAAVDQFKITEENLRKLKGLEPDRIERLIADVHKCHEKLLRRMDRHIKQRTQD